MKEKGLMTNVKTFLTNHSSTILTCLGSVGVVATAVTAAKATPKAIRMLEQAEELKGEKLTKTETIKIAGPAYIPSIMIGVSTIACIFGANILNKRQQASLASAYALLDRSYKEYRDKVKVVFGEDADRRVACEMAKDHYLEEHPNEDGLQLFYDDTTARFFRSTMDDVIKAEDYVKNCFETMGYVNMYDFYGILGINAGNNVKDIGWYQYDSYIYSEINFKHENVVLSDGTECCILSTSFD